MTAYAHDCQRKGVFVDWLEGTDCAGENWKIDASPTDGVEVWFALEIDVAPTQILDSVSNAHIQFAVSN